ncbi:MAG: sarcosine oxidase subunit gamma family protein [Pseudomonadota bacterium]
MGNNDFITPLSHLGLREGEGVAGGDGLHLWDRGRVGFFQILARKGRTGAVATALGFDEAPRLASHGVYGTAFATTPGEWVLVCNDDEASETLRTVSGALVGSGYVSDQSFGRAAFRLSGVKARLVLAKGCALDWSPSVRGAGACAQTSMAGIGVIIHQIDDAPTYDLYCYAGFADSFWRWLICAGEEFGVDGRRLTKEWKRD